jgi:hypothetical protein
MSAIVLPPATWSRTRQGAKTSPYGKTTHAHSISCYRTLDRGSLALVPCGKGSPGPKQQRELLAITLITVGHLAVSIALWKLSDKLAGLVSLIFFLAASGADLYEHFLHASANNVFMVAPGDWTPRFDASVFVLLALEIAGCLLGILLLGGRTRNNSQPKFAA